MTFDLFGIDIYWSDRLFGFWFCSFKNSDQEIHRSLFTIYWNNGELLIDLFWIHLLEFWI